MGPCGEVVLSRKVVAVFGMSFHPSQGRYLRVHNQLRARCRDPLPRRSWHDLCDQVAETVQLTSSQLALLGQVEVDLRTRQTDVSEVGG